MMKLRNNFPDDTRYLFDSWVCWECGQNGSGRGGLELHHIVGRKSASPFNCAPLCHLCHTKVTQTPEEIERYLNQTLAFLKERDYEATDEDWHFLSDVLREYFQIEIDHTT